MTKGSEDASDEEKKYLLCGAMKEGDHDLEASVERQVNGNHFCLSLSSSSPPPLSPAIYSSTNCKGDSTLSPY